MPNLPFVTVIAGVRQSSWELCLAKQGRRVFFSTSLLLVLHSDRWSSLYSQTLLGILGITHSLEDCIKMSPLLKGKRLQRRKYMY